MWEVKGNPVSPNWLNIEPTTVLYYYDGPRIFTCKDNEGEIYLAYQCGEDENLMRFLVVKIDEDAVRRLNVGEDSVRDALTTGAAWIFDFDYQWLPVDAWCVSVGSLPMKCVPRAEVMLWPHLPARVKPIIARSASTTQVFMTEQKSLSALIYAYS